MKKELAAIVSDMFGQQVHPDNIAAYIKLYMAATKIGFTHLDWDCIDDDFVVTYKM
jgi:hypothetical protein